VFSIIKIVAVIGFIILGIIIAAGGVPDSPQGYLGAHYWYDPGAFNHGFKGLCSVFVTAAFVSSCSHGLECAKNLTLFNSRSVEPSLLVSQLRRPQIPALRCQLQSSRYSGVSASSTWSA
jgi:hypothetical protein